MAKLLLKFTFFTTLLSNILFAQNNIEFEKLSSNNNISPSVVYSIQQDTIGNVWMATEDGVVRYNSSYSKIYNKYSGLPKHSRNRVNKVFISSKGTIFIGLKSGVCVYDKQLDTFKRLGEYSDKSPNLVKGFTEDAYGKIWVGAYNGLWCLNDELHVFEKVKTTRKQLIIEALHSGPNNKILLATQDGVVVYDASANTFLDINYQNKKLTVLCIERNKSDYLIGTLTKGLYKLDNKFQSIQKIPFFNKGDDNIAIRKILKDYNGDLYVGTDGRGIYKLDNDYRKITKYSHNEDELSSLSSNGVYDMVIGREKILWVATYGGGVNFTNRNKTVFTKVRHKLNVENSLKNNFTRAIEVDKNGKIWIGTKNGVSVWNPKTNNWKNIPTRLGVVLAIEADNNFMWIGSYTKGVFKININTLQTENYNKYLKYGVPKVYSILKDSDANIWIGGIRNDLIVVKNNGEIKTYPIREVKSIAQKSSGELLVAGRHGVKIYNKEKDEFFTVDALDNTREVYKYLTINAIDFKNNDELILGTNGAGVLLYNTKTKKMSSINITDGLPSDVVQGVIPLNEKEIWASTAKGLAQIKITSKDTIIQVFDKDDGLASTEFNYGSYKKISNNYIAFGGTDGLTFFNPNKVKLLKETPEIQFEEFSIFNKIVKPTSEQFKGHINTLNKLELNHFQNSISFKYIGVLHNSNAKVKYSWKIEGLSENWSTPSTNTGVNFTNLNSGEYVFRVKAANKFNQWGKERVLKIVIKAPWWSTNTAYQVYFLLIVGFVILVVYLTQFLVNKKSADEQIEFFNSLTHEIRTPLTILLSSLENISSSDDNEATKQVKKTITKMNALFEQMLNFKKATSDSNLLKNISKISLSAHLDELIGNFKPLSEERKITLEVLNNWNKEVFYFDKETLDKILFNLISNALKYTKEDGSIKVNLSETSKKELRIQVEDTGMGIPKDQQKYILKKFYRARNVVNSQKPGTGLGLMLVKSLVEKCNGVISFESEENKGTTFEVVIPNQEKLYKKSAVLEAKYQQEFEINAQVEINEHSDRKILIVEDNDELRVLLSKSLGTYFQVYEAKNGKEGLDAASQYFPDIILTDLIMPEMDGMQMAKALQADISLNHIPVFMMTVLNNSELKIESIESGVTEYIEKPLDINLLLAKITNTLTWQNKLREKYVHQSEKDEAVKYRNSKDESFITSLEEILFSKIQDTNFSVHDLCEGIGMSRTSLYMKLKNLIDLSPQDFIIHTKLKHAKKLLIQGGLSIKEVAYQSGFSNPKYFSTSFKKFYGMSPTGFLASLKKGEE